MLEKSCGWGCLTDRAGSVCRYLGRAGPPSTHAFTSWRPRAHLAGRPQHGSAHHLKGKGTRKPCSALKFLDPTKKRVATFSENTSHISSPTHTIHFAVHSTFLHFCPNKTTSTTSFLNHLSSHAINIKHCIRIHEAMSDAIQAIRWYVKGQKRNTVPVFSTQLPIS